MINIYRYPNTRLKLIVIILNRWKANLVVKNMVSFLKLINDPLTILLHPLQSVWMSYHHHRQRLAMNI